MSRTALVVAAAALVGGLILAYGNHFDNGFHFDDSHTIVQNVWIRDLSNMGQFFTNPETISTLPPNRQYRPLVTLSLAVDYWLGDGLDPFSFHLSTFLWYLVLLGLLFLFLQRSFGRIDSTSDTDRWALFAVAWYGLHAANAETINYVIARSDALSTVGVVAALTCYVTTAGRRRYLLLVPVVLGCLVKPTAAMTAPILATYIWLFEKDGRVGDYLRDRAALTLTVVTFVVAFATVGVVLVMTPDFVPGGASRFTYAITQPPVILHYVGNFLLPVRLSADTDWVPLETMADVRFIAGAAFLAALAAVVWRTRHTHTAPIAFGLVWFVFALAPTSTVVPLAEVLNDHRTFLPYIGLVVAATWTLRLTVTWVGPRNQRLVRPAVLGLLAAGLLGAHAWGAHQRSEIWQDDETLWYDVTVKSPRNGRGLMNYGLSQMRAGNYDRALEYFNRSLEIQPRYAYLHINLGVLRDAMDEPDVAETHFLQAIEYRPGLADGYHYYGRMLRQRGRLDEARRQLERALTLSPGLADARYDLMTLYLDQEDWEALGAAAGRTLAMAPDDARARVFLEASDEGRTRLQSAERLAEADPTPANWLEVSLQYYRAGRYAESRDAARRTLELAPDYGAAYNNVAAAEIRLGDWAAAVASATRAVEFAPGLDLARNNLAQARRLLDAERRMREADDEPTLLDLSLFFYGEGAYDAVIDAGERALALNPRSVVAYNNICSAYNVLERWNDAIDACEAALRIDPVHELATNNLALARRSRDRVVP